MRWRSITIITVLIMSSLFMARDVLACKGTEVLYEDTFATMDPAWGEPSTNLSAGSGKMTLTPEVDRRYAVLNEGNIYQDMDACVKVTIAKSDDPGWGGGLVFWAADYDNYYWFAVNGDGWFTVQRRLSGRDLKPVPWRQHAAAKKGIGQWNHVRVVTRGTQATIYINDTEVASFRGQPPKDGGFIGMFGDSTDKSSNVWEFSELKITKPTDAPVAPVTPTTPIPPPVPDTPPTEPQPPTDFPG